tara:strand:- start:6433 stop:7320 length:888 start_codon:yes stop_codon:yes gene_type:complete
MYVFLPISILMAWLFTAPIHLFMTVQDLQYELYDVNKKMHANLEFFERKECVSADKCRCLLLVHGLGDSAYTWSKTLRADKEEWAMPVNLYAVNLPGSGNSPQWEEASDYSTTKMAEKVFSAIEKECPQWDLVGNSFGGWITTKIAARYPKRVRSLTLLGAAGLNLSYDHITPMFAKPNAESVEKFQSMAYYEPTPLPKYIYSEIAKRMKRLPIKEMMLAQSPQDFVEQDIKKVKAPIYLIWGENDQVIPMNHALKFKELRPKARLEMARNCGHLPHKECFKVFRSAVNEQLLGI